MSEIMRKIRELGNKVYMIETLLTDYLLNQAEANAMLDIILSGEKLDAGLLNERRKINLLRFKGLIGEKSIINSKKNETPEYFYKLMDRSKDKKLKRLEI